MPPKKRGRGRGGRTSESPRKGGKASGRKRKQSESDGGQSASDSGDEFDKGKFMSIKRYDFDQLLTDERFDHPELVQNIEPEELNLDYYEKSGLSFPLHFRCDPARLGMTVPDDSVTVSEIRDMVGGKRLIEVVEVMNQGGRKMDLNSFVDYYNTPTEEKTELFNVLSLEFSLTPLADLVKSPKLVRDIDWFEQHWPDELIQRYLHFNKKGQFQAHHTFPKVQYYCLMSPSTCYTDFHIDFGGTSVWYHVKRGRKIFWLIEPTETNLCLYEEFIKSPEQSGFFGNVVEKCHRAELLAGDTMLIPSGWIHAVYTPADSLVFGGNFLHSMRSAMQIRVFQSENRINISKKFRFPYLEELVFYVIADYVQKATGRRYYRPGKLRDAKYDYVGKEWINAKGHHKPIRSEDFTVTVDGTSKEMDFSQDDKDDAIMVIAMHADSGAGTHSIMRVNATTGLEEEADSDDGEGSQRKSPSPGINKDDPTVFYDDVMKRSPFEVADLSTTAHRMKLDAAKEPELVFNEEYMSSITPALLVELERLSEYISKKTRVDVGEGITRPASLLVAFREMLAHRREELESAGVTIPNCRVECYGRRRTPARTNVSRTRATTQNIEDGGSVTMSEDTGGSQMGDDETQNEPAPMLEAEKKESREKRVKREPEGENSVKTEANEANEDDEVTVKEVPAEIDYDFDDLPPKLEAETETSDKKEEENNREEEEKPKKRERKARASATEGQKKRRKSKDQGSDDEEWTTDTKQVEKKKEKAKREKENKKRKQSSSFEDALKGGGASVPRPRTKKEKKDDKPLFVGGVPVAPTKELQEKRNDIYNYNPLESACALGHTPIQSAYRRSTKLNLLTPKFNTNKYKTGVRDHIMDEIAEEQNAEEHPAAGEGVAGPSPPPMMVDQGESLSSQPAVPSTSTSSAAPPVPKVPAGLHFNRMPPPRPRVHSVSSQPPPTPMFSERRTSFNSAQVLTPGTADRLSSLPPLPNLLPSHKPLISPIVTPLAQRISAMRHSSQESDGGSSVAHDEHLDETEEILKQQRAHLMTLEMITKEMVAIDTA